VLDRLVSNKNTSKGRIIVTKSWDKSVLKEDEKRDVHEEINERTCWD
jgi:hypothetical protein